MAGLEVVVRPIVFPNIRPQAPRVLAPEDDPTQGFCEIGGGGGQLIDLPYTFSWSMSRTLQHVEHGRASDTVRVFQEEEQTTGKKKKNTDNYVDLKVMKAALVQDGKGDLQEIQYRPVDEPQLADNVEILERDVVEWWNSK